MNIKFNRHIEWNRNSKAYWKVTKTTVVLREPDVLIFVNGQAGRQAIEPEQRVIWLSMQIMLSFRAQGTQNFKRDKWLKQHLLCFLWWNNFAKCVGRLSLYFIIYFLQMTNKVVLILQYQSIQLVMMLWCPSKKFIYFVLSIVQIYLNIYWAIARDLLI